ncbi:MAG TPA: hypothetical protein VMI10_18675 [Terriglobales bacterium]|nr:hypothetical protein [Terriglobales bacterium]
MTTGLAAGSQISNAANWAAPSTLAANPGLGGKTGKAARDFESILLTSLFDGLQRSFSFDTPDDASMPGASDYRLMGTRALAEAVAKAGGIGIARLVLDHLPAPKGTGE